MKTKTLKIISTTVMAIGMSINTLLLLLYAYLGTFTRYVADDYCFTGLLSEQGFWKAQAAMYNSWSNRYAGMFLVTLSDYLGKLSVQGWMVLTIVLLVISISYLLIQISRLVKFELPGWVFIFLAELFTTILIIKAPHQFQSIFWRIGVITYTLPLFFIALVAGLIIHFGRRNISSQIPWKGMLLCALLALFAGGLSETSLVLEITLLMLGIVAAVIWPSRENRPGWLWLLGATLVGSLISLVFVFLAPGNAVRQAVVPQPPGLIDLILMSVANAYRILLSMIGSPAVLLSAFLIALFLAFTIEINNDLPSLKITSINFAIFVMPVIAVLLVLCICVPSAYAVSAIPEERVLIEAMAIIVALFLAEGFLIGLVLGRMQRLDNEPVPVYLHLLVYALMLVIFLYPVYNSISAYRKLPELQQYAAAWDARDRQIRMDAQQGQKAIETIPLVHVGDLGEIETDPLNWVNLCAAQFYRVESIKAVDK